MNIAFLGLGRMGAGMAARLTNMAQHSLTVWNRSPDKSEPFKRLGARIATTPIDAVSGADLVITSLLDDKSIETLFHEQSPVIKAMQPAAIHLCVTTISPECANRLQILHTSHGSRYISGPVVGRPDASAEGKLLQFLAGDTSAITEVIPVCEAFTQKVIPLPGPARNANNQKLCINFFISSLLEVMAESFTLGEKLGVSRDHLASFFGMCLPHPGLKEYVDRIAKRETSSKTGFTMTAGRKDLALILDAANSVNCPVDIATIIANKMDSAISQGMENLDWSATQEITRQRAGL